MKKVLVALAMVGLGAAVIAGLSVAGEGEEEKSAEQTSMEQYMEAIAPGPHHEALNKRVGEWTATMKHFGAGAEPMVSTAKCKYELVLGGRFLTQQMEGEIMGQPFVGMGFYGFDKTSGNHTSYWVDSMGTQSVYAAGECSDHCMMETYKFTTADPMSGNVKEIKTVTLIKSDDEHVFEWYEKSEAGLVKTMEIVYTRAGS